MDESPTTEKGDKPSTGQPPDQPEEKSGVVLPQKVSELRAKLGQKAKQEPKFRFYALYDRIYRLDVLMAAWWMVLAERRRTWRGRAIVSGHHRWSGRDAFPQELQEELRTKRYRPQPVKRVYIPKPDGRLSTAGDSHGHGPDSPNGGDS